MVYRAFADFLESGKKIEKSYHGQKLSEKSHEKVNNEHNTETYYVTYTVVD